MRPGADDRVLRPTGSTVAREIVRSSLAEKGVPEERLDLATLLLCELLTDTIEHGEGAFELSVERRGEDGLLISVADQGPWFDAREASSTRSGLSLVERLSTDWGVRYVDTGIEVWFEL